MVAGRVVSTATQRQVRHVAVIPAENAEGLVRRVYQQVSQEMRIVVPPALLHSPSPDVLAAYWALTREPLMPAGRVRRAVKEAVATAVSVAASCPYCTDLHTAGLYVLSGEDTAEAIASDRPAAVEDDDLREIVRWARHAHHRDGPDLPAALTSAERGELVGVVVAFHYLSRMVNIFLPGGGLFPRRFGPAALRHLKRGAGRVLRPVLRDSDTPGRAAALLPAPVVSPATGWATASPLIADTLARCIPVFEAAGERWLSPATRRLVRDRLDRWDGEPTGLSTRWTDDHVTALPAPDRAPARLALLTALASHQVGPDTISEFRRRHPADAALVDVTAWAGFTAARRIGARQDEPSRAPRLVEGR
jgi:AhpD family alkylhydroperoxidase